MGAKRSSARRWTPSAARLARGVARVSDRDAVDCSMVVDLLEQNDKACLHRSTTFWRRLGQQPTASPLYFGPKMGDRNQVASISAGSPSSAANRTGRRINSPNRYFAR